MGSELPRPSPDKNISRLAGFALCFLAGLPSSLWAHATVQNSASAEWHWRPDVLFALIVFAFTYARGWVRLRNQSARIAKESQLALYLAGLASIAVALLSPVDALASTRLSMHIVQHLLLLMIAPLSFLLANPLTPFLWGLPTALRRGIGKIVARGSLFRRLLWASTLMPVTWSLYVVNLWVWHHPVLYQAALKNAWVHGVSGHMYLIPILVLVARCLQREEATVSGFDPKELLKRSPR